MQRILASMKTCCGRAEWWARPVYGSTVACDGYDFLGDGFQVFEFMESIKLLFAICPGATGMNSRRGELVSPWVGQQPAA